MINRLFSRLLGLTSLLVPVSHFAQPNLGSSANFVLFTSIGAITNTGPSQITGHVGSNSGAGTGFGNVNGNMYSGNGITSNAAADLLTAYGQLNSTTPGFFPASPLGNGATLTAGVYSLSANSVLSNTLTLNAQGTSTAVFIFLINGTFAANANSKVVLINGAQACNVFWKVEGAVSLATGSTIRGTIIANNAAISISSGVTLEGRAMSTAGAISINNLFAYTPIGCGSPLLTGPSAPVLGAAACYALFSSNGANTNVGVTTVTGDVGSNNGLTTGYNPLFVSGSVHAIPDLSTAQCSVDLGTTYTYLNTLPFDITLLFPAQFGNKLVLTPHTYVMNGAVSLTDTLYLNAQGNANAVFAIQVNGAFSAAAGSKIMLINGTQAKNVFWKIDGALSLNSGAIAKGTFIVNNAAIILQTGVDLEGRALSTTGAVSISASTVTLPPFFGTSTVAVAAQTVCAGSSATFVASGGGSTYQWRIGTSNLSNGGNISGATTATLVINPVGAGDAATNYNVMVSGACASSFTSGNMGLVVSSAPTLTTTITSQTVCAGSTVSFTFPASSGQSYQWMIGTTPLVNNAIYSGVTTNSLVINPANQAQASGNYNVVISGLCAPDFTTANIALVISSASGMTVSVPSQTVCEGNPATLTFTTPASGLNYQWRNGSTNLINNAIYTGVNTNTLFISGVTAAEVSANYNIVIAGPCAFNYTSANISLGMTPSASITAQAVSQTICAGNPVTFSISTTGNGLSYQWRKGSVNLTNGGNVSGANTASLTFNPAAVGDTSSTYNVIVSGGCAGNFTSANVSLAVNAAPGITSPGTSQTVCIGKSASFTAIPAGSGYTYQWRRGSSPLVNGASVSGVNSQTLTINPVSLADASAEYHLVITGNCAPNYTSANVELGVIQLIVADPHSNSPVCEGSAVTLSSQAIAGATYSWTGPDQFSSSSQNPVLPAASAALAGKYVLTITSLGCSSVPAEVQVTVNTCIDDDFFIPEGFSPNGDGINDVLVIRGITRFPDNQFVVFNRWGNKVFEASPYKNTWDGIATMGVRTGSDELPTGTYFYVLDLGNGTPHFKGTIYLNR